MNSKLINEQVYILSKNSINFKVKEEFTNKLLKCLHDKKPLLVKAGLDPTAADLHLGHSILLTKVRQFQNFGHNVIIIIGDFTAKIGDPSGNKLTRPTLSNHEIFINSKTYINQIFKILNPKKTLIKFNSTWLKKMNFTDIVKLASKYSIARMIERNDFKQRLNNGTHIGIHEILYPLFQGYDSVIIKPDIEIGGTDQLFNLLVSRNIMKKFQLEPQCIMTVPLLEGTDSKSINGKIIGKKMSKSLNNYISLTEDPNLQFGKLMSICDEVMWHYYDLLSSKSDIELLQLKKIHPKKAKEILALEIVSRYHGKQNALRAQQEFNTLFGTGNRNIIPKNAPSIQINTNGAKINILKILIISKLVISKREAKYIIKQKCVIVNNIFIENINHLVSPGKHKIRVGKKRWAHIYIK